MFSSALLIALVASASAAHATVAPTTIDISIAQGSSTIRTITFTNPENSAVTVTATAIGVADQVMLLNSSQTVQPGASTTFNLWISATKAESGLIILKYADQLEFVPITISLSGGAENLPSGGSGYLAVTYDLYVKVGEPETMIIRDASTKEAILDANVIIDSPTPMTISAVSGTAQIPIEDNGIYTGTVQASGYKKFNFVMVAKGQAASSTTIASVTSSPSPMYIGQAATITATTSTGVAAQNVTLVINGVSYPSNPAVIVPTSSLVAVQVKDSSGNSLYGPVYLSATQQQQQTTTPKSSGGVSGGQVIGGIFVVLALVGAAYVFTHRGGKTPFKRQQ